MKILIPIFLTGLLISAESSPFNITSLFKDTIDRIIAFFNKKIYNNQIKAAPFLSTPTLITNNGYDPEIHIVVTDDGYILEIHRIPYHKKLLKQRAPTRTILLHHGILGSSADWVLAGPENSLAYILSKAYYDVWMANARGNIYSRAHLHRDVNSYAFWNFTFHEVGQYDLPAVINYIIQLKGEGVEINYIGFSMGATALFSLLSTKTQYNNILNAAFAIAPIVYTSNVKGPLRLLAQYSSHMSNWMKTFGAKDFIPSNEIMSRLSDDAYLLNHGKDKRLLSKNLFFLLCGHDKNRINKSLLPVILDHIPAGTSTKMLIHYAQEIRDGGKFQQFDYGQDRNMKQYGNDFPPIYQLENVNLPVVLISANNDWLSVNEDVERLFDKLPNPIEHYVVPKNDFNHADFLFGIDAPILVFDKLLELLNLYSKDV